MDLFDEEFYTVAQVADLFKCSRYVVNRLIDRGDLEAQRFGRNYRISANQLRAYIAKTNTKEQQQ